MERSTTERVVLREQKSTDVPPVGTFFDKELTGEMGRMAEMNMNVMIALAPNERPRLH